MNCAKPNIATPMTQLREVSLGEGLIFPFESFWEGDIFEFTTVNSILEREFWLIVEVTQRIDHAKRDVIEGLSASRTTVVDTRNRFIQEVQQYSSDIIDVD